MILSTFTESEEATSWDEHEVTEYFDRQKVKLVRFANLKTA